MYADDCLYGEDSYNACDTDDICNWNYITFDYKSTDIDDREYDIIEIYREGKLIYEKPKVEELTLKEICKRLGYDVKIIKEDK